jgi:hypothetical protein
MDFWTFQKKLRRKLLYWLCWPYLAVKKNWSRKFYAKRILERLKSRPPEPPNSKADLFFSAAFRVNSKERQNILGVSVAETFKNLSGCGLRVGISDASIGEYVPGNREIFAKIGGLRIDYNVSNLKLPPALLNLLGKAAEKYFLMFFDDQPIVGLTAEFLAASCSLLSDFAGLVDLIYISDAPKQIINHANKTLIYNMADLIFRVRGVKPLCTVAYGNYSYAIIPNVLCGFFFNTIIAPAADYRRRLKWYADRVSANDPTEIEIVGSQYQGPVYHFLAVPLSVFQINIDYSHTESSVRNYPGAILEEICDALKNNYRIIVKT